MNISGSVQKAQMKEKRRPMQRDQIQKWKDRLATELLLKKIHDNESDSNLGEIMDVEIVDRQSVISLY